MTEVCKRYSKKAWTHNIFKCTLLSVYSPHLHTIVVTLCDRYLSIHLFTCQPTLIIKIRIIFSLSKSDSDSISIYFHFLFVNFHSNAKKNNLHIFYLLLLNNKYGHTYIQCSRNRCQWKKWRKTQPRYDSRSLRSIVNCIH